MTLGQIAAYIVNHVQRRFLKTKGVQPYKPLFSRTVNKFLIHAGQRACVDGRRMGHRRADAGGAGSGVWAQGGKGEREAAAAAAALLLLDKCGRGQPPGPIALL